MALGACLFLHTGFRSGTLLTREQHPTADDRNIQ